MIKEFPRGDYLIDEGNLKSLLHKAYTTGYSNGRIQVRNAAECNFWLGLVCGVGVTIGGIMFWYYLKEEQEVAEEFEVL